MMHNVFLSDKDYITDDTVVIARSDILNENKLFIILDDGHIRNPGDMITINLSDRSIELLKEFIKINYPD